MSATNWLSLLVVFGVAIGHSVGAGAEAPVRPNLDVEQDLLKIIEKVKSPADLIAKLATRMLPGDDFFLQQKLLATPELREIKKMPTVQLDHGVFVISFQKLETAIRLDNYEKWEFEINHQHVSLRPGMLAFERWLRLTDVLAQAHASHFAFLPVAFAMDSSAATVPSLMAMALTSAIVHGHASALAVKVRTSTGQANYTDVWHKALEAKTRCSNQLLSHMAQKLAELQVSELRCEELPNKSGKGFHLTGRTIFQLPFGDNGQRTLLLDSEKALAHEQAPDLGGRELLYTRSSRADPPSPLANGKIKTIDSVERVSRQKGMAWLPVASQDPALRERAEQLRELLNEAYVDDFCGRCGLIFHTAVGQIGSQEDELPPQQPSNEAVPVPAGATQH